MLVADFNNLLYYIRSSCKKSELEADYVFFSCFFRYLRAWFAKMADYAFLRDFIAADFLEFIQIVEK